MKAATIYFARELGLSENANATVASIQRCFKSQEVVPVPDSLRFASNPAHSSQSCGRFNLEHLSLKRLTAVLGSYSYS